MTSEQPSKAAKVLIVDDDPMVVKSLERILQAQHFLLYSVFSGEDALQAIYNVNPDIILLDILMPGMDGFRVCQTLKSDPLKKQIPVIFLSSTTSTSDIVKGFEAGAVDYITKPFQAAELIARLRTHLELKQAREEILNTNLLKTKFFNLITNDIKNALIGVKGVANFLLQELKSQEGQQNESLKLARILYNDSNDLYLLLQNLIEWATVEADYFQPEAKSVNLFTLIHQIKKENQFSLAQKELLFNIECPEDFVIFSNPEALHNILDHLLSNAIKYSATGSSILFRIAHQDDKIHMQLEDFGVGMDPEIADQIFKLDNPHPKTIGTAGEKGTGLGLIICRALMEKLHGHIRIETKKRQGIIVHLELPARG